MSSNICGDMSLTHALFKVVKNAGKRLTDVLIRHSAWPTSGDRLPVIAGTTGANANISFHPDSGELDGRYGKRTEYPVCMLTRRLTAVPPTPLAPADVCRDARRGLATSR